MAIEAPLSKYNKTNYKIYTFACLIVAAVLAYDGWLSKYQWSMRRSFYEEHVIANDGKPDSTMNFNRYFPVLCLAGAAFFGYKLKKAKDKKIIADEQSLQTPEKTISYDSIQSIDKTHFESKNFFTVNYKDENQNNAQIKLNTRQYDNLQAVLDKIVEKIS